MFLYNFAILPEATQEIQNIKFYIKHVLCNTKASEDFESALFAKIAKIRQEPHIYPSEWKYNRLYYKAMVKKYIFAYFIDESTKTIHITSVGHELQKNRVKR